MKKMDEMELSINLKAIKCAWVYTVLFLAIWVMNDFIKTGTLGFEFLLLISQNMVLLGFQMFLKWKQTINAIENEKYNPTLELAMKLAKLLNTTVDELFIFES